MRLHGATPDRVVSPVLLKPSATADSEKPPLGTRHRQYKWRWKHAGAAAYMQYTPFFHVRGATQACGRINIATFHKPQAPCTMAGCVGISSQVQWPPQASALTDSEICTCPSRLTITNPPTTRADTEKLVVWKPTKWRRLPGHSFLLFHRRAALARWAPIALLACGGLGGHLAV